jgi:pilus assembly protein CpaC
MIRLPKRKSFQLSAFSTQPHCRISHALVAALREKSFQRSAFSSQPHRTARRMSHAMVAVLREKSFQRSAFSSQPDRTARRISHALVAALLWTGGLTAQTVAPIQTMSPSATRAVLLIEGTGELLQFDRDIQKVAISEPKIADAVVISARDVMINAKGPGQATLVVWEAGNTPTRYNIRVTKDMTDADALHGRLGASLKAGLPDSVVEFNGDSESVLLTGRVASAELSKRAEAIAGVHTKKVVNMLTVGDPRQILLEVKFADVDRTALSQLGFNLLSRNSSTLGAASTQQFPEPLFTGLGATAGLSNTALNLTNLLNLFIFRPDLNIGATIQALQQQNLAQILAEPNLIVVEGSEASFLAGGEFPFPTVTSTPTTGSIAPVVTVQFKKYGVQLNFTPTGTASGSINLKVKPEVSALDFANAVTVDGVLIPAISSRVAETEVVLKDGESFAIAGLIDNRVTQIMSKVKGLGDLPILGQLFRSRSTQKTTDELMVVVTARFVKPVAKGEEIRLPQIVTPFLPPAAPEKKGKGKGKSTSAPADSKKPEFVGQQGYVIPKQ